MPSTIEETARVQLTGILAKRPVNIPSQGGLLANRFYRRFFVVKDGFLLYYPESEKREFERRKCANYQPRGIIPLGDCSITKHAEQDYQFLISINNELSMERLIIQCESLWEQERWIDMLERSSRISWKNAELGDSVINQLRLQGDRLAQERESVYMKLHEEVKALSDEKEKTSEMEQLLNEMEEEKKRLEETTHTLQEQYEQTNSELELTIATLKELETEKQSLTEEQSKLAKLFVSLELQKKETEELLQESLQKSSQLEDCNRHLSMKNKQTETVLDDQIKAEQTVRSTLEQKMKQIEEQMSSVMQAKDIAENKVKEQSELAQLLQDEKTIFFEEAKELQKDLADVKYQKSMTENELKEEIKARIRAEEKLKEAEKALANIEMRLEEAVVVSDHEKHDVMRSVKALKKYFEEKAIEQKVEAERPIIMKRAVYNKRRNLRAQSVRIIRDPELSLKVEDSSLDLIASTPEVIDSTQKLRNSASTLLKNKALRAEIAKTVHQDLRF